MKKSDWNGSLTKTPKKRGKKKAEVAAPPALTTSKEKSQLEPSDEKWALAWDKVKAALADGTIKDLKTHFGVDNPAIGFDLAVRNSNSIESKIPGLDSTELMCSVIKEMNPQGTVEVMLCSQAYSLHCLGMEFVKRAINGDMRNHIDANVNNAVKLLRLQHETIEALAKLRRNGEQKVIVQHVQVNDGGKAIVGGVFEGGGLSRKANEVCDGHTSNL